MEKKERLCLQDNNSPNRTDYPRETESGEKRGKVLPSDNNSPNRTDYPRETEPGELGEPIGEADVDGSCRSWTEVVFRGQKLHCGP